MPVPSCPAGLLKEGEIGFAEIGFDFRPKRPRDADGAEKFVRRNLSRAAEGEGEKIARLFAAEDEPKRLCAVCRERTGDLLPGLGGGKTHVRALFFAREDFERACGGVCCISFA